MARGVDARGTLPLLAVNAIYQAYWFVPVLFASSMGTPRPSLVVTFALSVGEDHALESIGFPNTYNALQITKQLYSFVVLAALIKLRVRLVPAIITSLGMGAAHLVIGQAGWLAKVARAPLQRLAVWFIYSTLVYILSLVATRMLRTSSLAWTVGRRAMKAPRQSPSVIRAGAS